MVQIIPPGPYKTETDADQVIELKQMFAVFFHTTSNALALWEKTFPKHIKNDIQWRNQLASVKGKPLVVFGLYS